MAKRIHHMGMVVERDQHEDFHKRAPEMTPRQHDALMRRMDITPEEDTEWHERRLALGELRAAGLKHVDLCAIGTAFSEFCVRQGWMEHKGKDYLLNKIGVLELRGRFDISL